MAPDDTLWATYDGKLLVSGSKTRVDEVTGRAQTVPIWPPTGDWVAFHPQNLGTSGLHALGGRGRNYRAYDEPWC